MKYTTGGVTVRAGEAASVEVAVAGAQQQSQPQPAGPVVQQKGDDVIVDPPVRNLPQWDGRWGQKQIAGKKGAKINWQENGCNASTAAMTLRWFAEDCPAGKVAFPRKPAGSISQSWYSLAMAESMWPNADPPGKVALDTSGRIDVPWIFAACAEYLRSGGNFPRADNGDVGHPAKKACSVESAPSEGWLSLLKKMLKTGPVIMGIGAPAGHYVIAQAVIGGAVAIVDPGNVLYQAAKGGGGPIQNWQSMASGFADGSSGADKVRMPQSSQWPGGSAPGNEADPRAYNLVSGQFLQKLLDNLVRLVSLTYPDGAAFGGGAQPQQQPSQQQGQSQGQQQQASQPQPQQQQQAAPQAAPAKGRTRMSIFCFGTPFIKGFSGSGVQLDDAVLDKLVESRVDDVSLVNTLAPPESNWAPGGVVKDTAIAFSSGFRPAAQSKYSADFLDKLIAGCHARNVQVMIGYCIGNDPNNKSGDSYCKNFTDWLAAMSADQVKAHAQAVVDFVNKVQADGITFDLEIVSLGAAQKDNLWLFYKTLAEMMPNKMVAYATGPFTEEGKVDGVDCMSGIQIQSYTLAKQAPNLVARPMCYDEHAFDLGVIQRSIDYALGAAGLSASQIQMGIYCTDPNPKSKNGGTQPTLQFTRDVMAPKRVSMIYYQVPGGTWNGSKMDTSPSITALAHVKDFEALMNPGEAAPGASGAPLQVPR